MEKDDLENRAEPSEFQLIKGDARKHYGKYVVLDEFNQGEVIAYGKNPIKVVKKAREKGITDPLLIHVPDPNISEIYSAA